jgi:alpha-tubulin suppressor-like RCC1 family protein
LQATPKVTIGSNSNIVEVYATQFLTFLLADNGAIYAHGINMSGAMCNGNSSGTVPVPTLITIPNLGGRKIVAMSAGDHHAIFLADDGTVFTCGVASQGALGNGVTTKNVLVPTAITIPSLGNRKIVRVCAGDASSMLLADDGTIYVFGSSYNGRLCNGQSTGNVLTPTTITVPGLNTRKIVRAGSYFNHAILVADDGAVFTCGGSEGGALGDGKESSQQRYVVSPQAITVPKKIVEIGGGLRISLLCAEDGTVYGFGELVPVGGFGTENVLSPVQMDIEDIGTRKIIKVSTYSRFGILLANDGTVFTFGISSYGKLGNGESNSQDTGYRTAKAIDFYGNSQVQKKKIIAIATGAVHSAVVSEDSAVYSWGSKMEYLLGNGQTTNTNDYESTPVKILAHVECQDISPADPLVCHGRGTCLGPDNCTCSSSYSGSSCDQPVCFGVPATSREVCSYQGTCDAPDHCSCNTNYGGDMCNIPTCDGISASNTTYVCSGRGECGGVDSCYCKQRYYGQNCENTFPFECFGVSNTAANVCSGKGECWDEDVW